MSFGVMARCPLCESSGTLGSLCVERVCARQGVHCVPESDALDEVRQLPSQREPLIGHFVGDYLVTRRLGKGGFGKVLLAIQRPLFKLRVAVKLMAFQVADERAARKIGEKFENEAAALAVLQHPNIVRLLQFGEFDGKPFMAMEYVPGARTLQNEIHGLVLGHGALAPEQVRHVLTQILNGLEAAHVQGLIHRDIKPENVMLQAVVGDPLHVKLVDFGLAKDVAANRDTSMVLGTVSYMSPEQIEGKDLGPWTDCYAVGAIAFELLVGRRPLPTLDTQDLLRWKLDPRSDPFGDVTDHGLSPDAEAFLRKALARYPEERFRSAAEMRTALGSVFSEPSAVAAFSNDLSRLVSSEEIAHLRSQEILIAEERKSIDCEWRRLEAARRDLESERARLSSRDLGRSGEVGHPSEAAGVQASTPLRTDATLALDPGHLPARAVPQATATVGASDTLRGADAAPRTVRGRGRWLAAAALVALGAVAVAVVVSQTAPSAPPDEAVIERAEVPTPLQALSAPTRSAPTPDATASPVRARQGLEAPTVAPEQPVVGGEAPTVDGATAVASTDVPPAKPAAFLSITTRPRGADVLVDGEAVGKSPWLHRTDLGASHAIELRLHGYEVETRAVAVDRETVAMDVTLRRAAPRMPPPPTAAREPAAAPAATTPTFAKPELP